MAAALSLIQFLDLCKSVSSVILNGAQRSEESRISLVSLRFFGRSAPSE
jgi:hypothetical protein